MAVYGVSTYGTPTGITASEIKNLALFELGFVDEIDFTDTTNETVKKVNRIYPTVYNFVLSNYPWRFVIKRKQLTTRSEATDEYKYKYSYSLPANLLAIKNIFSDNNYSSPIREYESGVNYVNTGSSTVYLSYISQIDEVDFPQYFIDYFKYKLAMELCFNLTGDTKLLEILAMKEQRGLLTSKNIDARQNMTRTIRTSPFASIRG